MYKSHHLVASLSCPTPRRASAPCCPLCHHNKKGCAGPPSVIVMSPAPAHPRLRGWRFLSYPVPWPKSSFCQGGEAGPSLASKTSFAWLQSALIFASATFMGAKGNVEHSHCRLLVSHGEPSPRSDQNKRRKW